MSRIIKKTIKCDGCGEERDIGIEIFAKARQALKKEGWGSDGNNKDHCNACVRAYKYKKGKELECPECYALIDVTDLDKYADVDCDNCKAKLTVDELIEPG